MTVTATSGTQTAVIGTEHFVADIALSGVYTFEVDRNAMVDGDVLELRVYKMILTSGTARLLFPPQSFYGAVPSGMDPIQVSIPITNELTDSTSLRFSLKQTFGTGRAYPWKAVRIN